MIYKIEKSKLKKDKKSLEVKIYLILGKSKIAKINIIKRRVQGFAKIK